MNILKLFRNCQIIISESTTLQILSGYYGSSQRFYSDRKCDEIRGKHRLVPCKEGDTVPLCIEEPIQINANYAKVPCKENYHRVIIVGAGIAGLSAATRLMACNMQDFIILEAKDRPGGRVETRKLGNTLIELGAEFIEGASVTNPIYQLACIHDLISDKTQRIQHRGGIFLLSDNRAIDASNKALRDLKGILDDLPVAATRDEEASCSVFDHVEHKMKQVVETYKDWEKDNAMRMVYSILNDMRSYFGVDPSNISVKTYGSRVVLPGGRIRFDKGASELISALLKKIPKDKVVINKGVQTIWWCDGNDGCRVRCWDGTEYRACHVIVTMSLGVLRSMNTLFCPCLPPEKMQAIRDIPFGRTAKLFLRYNEPFWLDPELTLRFGWMKEELGDRQDWIKGIGSIEELPSATDHIIRVSIGGREAKSMECNKDAVMELLCWLQNSIGTLLPLPNEVVATCWNNDILTGGSASFSAPCLQKILAEPLPGRDCPSLLFAGEATVAGYSGSMHSAAKSGVREADNLLKVIKKFTDEAEKVDKEYEKTVADHEKSMQELVDCKEKETATCK